MLEGNIVNLIKVDKVIISFPIIVVIHVIQVNTVYLKIQ